jgi:dethiobiotin synthetase
VSLARSFFITGTDTGVGKTLVASGLARLDENLATLARTLGPST